MLINIPYKITGSIDYTLLLLEVLKRYTSNNKRWSKNKLIEEINRNILNYAKVEFKSNKISSQTFDRSINKLLDNKFDIIIDVEGYCYRKEILSSELCNTILQKLFDNDTVSNEDLRAIAFFLRKNESEIDDKFLSYDRIEVNYLSILEKVNCLFESIYRSKMVKFKLYKNEIVSEYIVGNFNKIFLEKNDIVVKISNKKYLLNEIINISVEE